MLNKRIILERIKNGEISIEDGKRLLISETLDDQNSVYLFRRIIEERNIAISSNSLNETILVFNPNEDFVKSLNKKTSNIISVYNAEKYRKISGNIFEINYNESKDYSTLITNLLESDSLPKYILYNLPPRKSIDEIESLTKSLVENYYSLLFLTQAIMNIKTAKEVRTLFMYDVTQSKLFSSLSGFAKSLFQENPKYIYTIIGIDTFDNEFLCEIAINEFLDVENEYEVYYKNSKRFTVNFSEIMSLERSTPAIKENGNYLITGGAGGLGLLFAEYLSQNFNANIILTGRSELTQEIEQKIKKIDKTGKKLFYIKADISTEIDVKNLILSAKDRFGCINGIIHSAGVNRDSYIFKKTCEEATQVIAPKITGTLLLDKYTSNEQIDFFVMFSSIAASIGNTGQSDYAFANNFMDYFCEYRESLVSRNERFGKTISFNWPLWKEGGMHVDEQKEKFFFKTWGMKPLQSKLGLSAFEAVLDSNINNVLVIEGEKEKIKNVLIRKKYTEKKVRGKSCEVDLQKNINQDLVSLVCSMLKVKSSDIDIEADINDYGFDSVTLTELSNVLNDKFKIDLTPAIFFEYSTIASISSYISEEFNEKLLKYYNIEEENEEPVKTMMSDIDIHEFVVVDLVSLVCSMLKVKSSDIDIEADINDYGFDSVTLTELSNVLNDKFKIDLTPAIFFEYSTIASISSYISEEFNEKLLKHYNVVEDFNKGLEKKLLSKEEYEEIIPNTNNLRFINNLREAEINNDIAIIGMSGVFPGSENLDQYWENLEKCNDLISTIPRNRWDWKVYEDQNVSKWGGFINDIDKFDPLFFNISPREAESMDPQQRMFLQTVWKTIEDAGYKPSSLAGSNTGLFLGISTWDYSELMEQHSIDVDPQTSIGTVHSMAVNRISFLLDLHGPSIPIDTACSSSLVAIHYAIEAIRNGSCDMAIAGGVNALITPRLYISFSKAGMMSPDGRCKTFDKSANGYVRGEGVGAILLKPLAEAVKSGDTIYAVIKSTSVNHGGHAKSLTAPNPNAQAELLIDAYTKSGVPPSTISYIETHGTGTGLGDPVEINGLKKAFDKLIKDSGTEKKSFNCSLGSAKTNIGHLESAAGIAGVIKVLLAMKFKKIPGVVHFKELNPYIKLDDSPFTISEKTKDWLTNNCPRRAGVSSFGFGGVNAHVVLEEYESADVAESRNSKFLFILSAKNFARLKEYAESMSDYIKKNDKISLANLAFTLQIGREEMDERLAIAYSNIDELKNGLNDFINGKNDSMLFETGNVKIRRRKSDVFFDSIFKGEKAEHHIELIIKDNDYKKIGLLWVSGIAIDWSIFYKDQFQRRISIPTYPFEKKKCWISLENSIQSNNYMNIINDNISTLLQQKYLSTFTGKEFYLMDHIISEAKTLPGVIYLELAKDAGEKSITRKVNKIRDVMWKKPVIVSNNTVSLTTYISYLSDNELNYDVCDSNNPSVIYSSGLLDFKNYEYNEVSINIKDIKDRCNYNLLGEECYRHFSKMGLNYGDTFRVIKNMFRNENEILTFLELDNATSPSNFCLHPSVLDGALQSVLGFVIDQKSNIPLVPFQVESIEIRGQIEMKCFCYVTKNAKNKFEICLLDSIGNILIKFINFDARPYNIQGKDSNKIEDESLYQILLDVSSNEVKYSEAIEKLEVMYE